MNQIKLGMGAWSTLKSLGSGGGSGGAQFLTATQVQPNGAGQLPAGAIQVVNAPGTGIGRANCFVSPPVLQLDALTFTLAELPNLAAHEMGHMFGLAHSGQNDNTIWNNQFGIAVSPIMETCTSIDPSISMTHDDEGQALSRHYGTAKNGNPGFEWDPTNGTALTWWDTSAITVKTSGGLPSGQGTKFVELAPNGFIERHHVQAGPTTSRSVRVRLSYKMASGASAGPNYKLYYMARNYPTLSPDNCGFSYHQDLNNPTRYPSRGARQKRDGPQHHLVGSADKLNPEPFRMGGL